MFVVLMVYAFLSGVPALTPPAEEPHPLWSDDVLIWDMAYNSTWAGSGITYCTGICDCQGTLYSSCIIDSPIAGSVFRIYSSLDGGLTWEYAGHVSGSSWYLTDPEMFTSSEEIPEFLTCIYAATSSTTQPKGIRFTLPDFDFDGFINPDWPSSADTLRSVEAVCHPESGELWVFGNDSDNHIYLTRSTDNGDSWTPAVMVATDAILPSAAAGPQGYVYLTYRRCSDNRIMCLSFDGTSFFEAEVAYGGDTSAPVIASEKAGDEVLAIAFHDENFDIRLAISYNYGDDWTLSDPISSGYYPFIDVLNYSRRCAMGYIDFETDQIYYSSAISIEALLSEIPEPISDEDVFLGGPPVIRYGGLTSGVSLFYMGWGQGGPAPRDMWFDNSLNTQSNPEPEISTMVFSVGPNPFTEGSTVRIELLEPLFCTLDLYSIDGRLVESLFTGVTERRILQIGNDLPAGIYSIVLRSGSSITSKRVVKL